MNNSVMGYEEFMSLAEDIGLDIHNQVNLELLYPEVVTMLERMEIIGNVATDEIHLRSNVDLVSARLHEGT
mgnify:CR=1 FL=1|tara:strand:+ start:512 stop:724 length:213 start_codon:yes stop_codon:yes gene_type:complete